MNAQITEMAKRFMVEQYGSWRIKHGDLDRDRWDESLSLVILALEFAEKERGGTPSDYHRVMSLIRATKLPHGTCQPRSDRACTHCNAQEQLDELITAYKGAPIKAA